MSYILDALRKSEQQRRQGAAPEGLLTPAAAPAGATHRFHGWIALVLIGVGIAIGWLQPWRGEADPPVTRQVEARPAATSAAGVMPAEAVATTVPKTATPARAEPVPAAAAPAPNEPPPAIRQEIPSLTISLHGYSSDPAERMVMINGRLLREGDDLAAGLRLEQVTPDGAILGYKGYRIHSARP